MAGDKKRIVLLDDHPFVRRGMAEVIEESDDLTVEAEFTHGLELIEYLRDHQPDLAVVDLTLKDVSGLSVIREALAIRPTLKILVSSMHDELVYAERALKSGATGYLMKDQAMEMLIRAARVVLDGEIYLSDQMTSFILKKSASGAPTSSPMELLTDRELEVLRQMGLGRGSREIAEDLEINIKTVETYKERLKDKLGLANASQLMHYAVEMKWK